MADILDDPTGWAYEFVCDSLGEELLQDTDSFFWCIVCRNLEQSIFSDINNLSNITRNFNLQKQNINTISQSKSVTPTNLLDTYIGDFKTRADSLVVNMSNPVQETGSLQTSYNSYQQKMRDFSSSLQPDVVTRMGANYTNDLGMNFPQKFMVKSSSPTDDCLNNLINSYNCGEFDIFNLLNDLLRNFLDLFSFLWNISNGISGYNSIGCSEVKALNMEGLFNNNINQLPLDLNYNFDPEQLISDLDIPLDFQTSISKVNTDMGSSLNSVKDRIKI